jgi:hypothetical protein
MEAFISSLLWVMSAKTVATRFCHVVIDFVAIIAGKGEVFLRKED